MLILSEKVQKKKSVLWLVWNRQDLSRNESLVSAPEPSSEQPQPWSTHCQNQLRGPSKIPNSSQGEAEGRHKKTTEATLLSKTMVSVFLLKDIFRRKYCPPSTKPTWTDSFRGFQDHLSPEICTRPEPEDKLIISLYPRQLSDTVASYSNCTSVGFSTNSTRESAAPLRKLFPKSLRGACRMAAYSWDFASKLHFKSSMRARSDWPVIFLTIMK